MRVINLDDTGIKIITANREQLYLSKAQARDFLAKKLFLNENQLKAGNQIVTLSESDMEELDSTYDYVEKILNKG